MLYLSFIYHKTFIIQSGLVVLEVWGCTSLHMTSLPKPKMEYFMQFWNIVFMEFDKFEIAFWLASF